MIFIIKHDFNVPQSCIIRHTNFIWSISFYPSALKVWNFALRMQAHLFHLLSFTWLHLRYFFILWIRFIRLWSKDWFPDFMPPKPLTPRLGWRLVWRWSVWGNSKFVKFDCSFAPHVFGAFDILRKKLQPHNQS